MPQTYVIQTKTLKDPSLTRAEQLEVERVSALSFIPTLKTFLEEKGHPNVAETVQHTNRNRITFEAPSGVALKIQAEHFPEIENFGPQHQVHHPTAKSLFAKSSPHVVTGNKPGP